MEENDLIPCEICNNLIPFENYNQHLVECSVPRFNQSDFPPLNLETDSILTRENRERNRLLSFINDIDELINRLSGVETYDNLINLDSNNVVVGVDKIEDFVTKKKEEIQCPICTETKNEIGETICGHKFCYECIEEWLKESKKCPICMKELNQIN